MPAEPAAHDRRRRLDHKEQAMFDKNNLPNGFYLAEFDFSGSPRGAERTVIECHDGFCYTTNDAAIEKIDLWAARAPLARA
jgi:hypothetical protein